MCVDTKRECDCLHIMTSKNVEVNYSFRHLELAAVVFALKLYRHYMYGTKYMFYIDHKSL